MIHLFLLVNSCEFDRFMCYYRVSESICIHYQSLGLYCNQNEFFYVCQYYFIFIFESLMSKLKQQDKK